MRCQLSGVRPHIRQLTPDNRKKMLGTILCGGQSTRMGTDKGLLKLHANTWAKTAADKLATLSLPVILSVNENQFTQYSSIFPASSLIKDDPLLNLKGPLCGVLSVHLKYPTEDLIIIACDMPLLDPVLFSPLLTKYEQEPDGDAFLYSNDGEPEPLCGIYKASGLAQIVERYKNNELPKHSMKFMLEHINTMLLPLPEEQKKSFRNFNAHAELNGL
jgi:molybdenum cofactor guanylyltransferase